MFKKRGRYVQNNKSNSWWKNLSKFWGTIPWINIAEFLKRTVGNFGVIALFLKVSQFFIFGVYSFILFSVTYITIQIHNSCFLYLLYVL